MSECKHPRGNSVITPDFLVLNAFEVDVIPGCICAFSDGIDGRSLTFAVVHEDNKTKVLMLYGKFYKGEYKVLLEKDELIDIINITAFTSRGNHIYIFSTPEGVKFVLNSHGKKVRLPENIPKDTVGIVGRYSVRYDGTITDIHSKIEIVDKIKGYDVDEGDPVAWTDNKILDVKTNNSKDIIKFSYRRTIDHVYIVRGSKLTRGSNLLMVLSEGIIHIKAVHADNTVETFKMIGRWRSIPMLLGDMRYIIDINGILRDIRSAIDDSYSEFFKNYLHVTAEDYPDMLYSTEPSLYERNIRPKYAIGRYHGLRVFTPPKMVKSARKVAN